MKKKISALSVSLWKSLFPSNLGTNKNTCLLFHAFGQDLDHDNYGMSIPISQFMEHVRRLPDFGLEFVSVEQLNRSAKRSISITIDDGYKDTLLASEELTKLQIPFTIYMVVSELDRPGFLTKQDLRSLHNNPFCTIGSHTMTHPYLTRICESDMLYEVLDSKKELENILGDPVEHFSFPYGDRNRKITDFVRKNYKFVATSSIGHNEHTHKPLNRIEITKYDSFGDWIDKISGFHDFKSFRLKEVKRWF